MLFSANLVFDSYQNMKHLLRIALTPLAFVSLVLGFITGKWLIFGTAAMGLLIFDFVYYSNRKQRIRYWLQGYKEQLEKNGDNEKDAIRSIQKEFCASKYADEHVCRGEYNDVEILITDIIKREYRFERLLSPSSQGNTLENIKDYVKAVADVKIEITNIRKEVL